MPNPQRDKKHLQETALHIFLALGPGRTFPILIKTLEEKFGADAPKLHTLKTWSSDEKWKKKAFDWDAKWYAEVDRQISVRCNAEMQKQVEEGAVRVWNAREELDKTSEKLVTRVNEWLDNGQAKSAHVKNASDAAALLRIAHDNIRQSEVLRGGVSDRVAIERAAQADERKQAASERALPIMKRIIEIQKNHGLIVVEDAPPAGEVIDHEPQE